MTACPHLPGIRLLAREQRGCRIWRNGTHPSGNSTGSHQASERVLRELAAGSSAEGAVADPRLPPCRHRGSLSQLPALWAPAQRSFSGGEKNVPAPWEAITASEQGERGAFTRGLWAVSPWEVWENSSLSGGPSGRSEKTVRVKEILFSTKQHRIRLRVTMVTVPRKLPQAYSRQTFMKGVPCARQHAEVLEKEGLTDALGPRSLERRATPGLGRLERPLQCPGAQGGGGSGAAHRCRCNPFGCSSKLPFDKAPFSSVAMAAAISNRTPRNRGSGRVFLGGTCCKGAFLPF